MRTDVSGQVRAYAEHLESLVDAWEIEDVLAGHDLSPVPIGRRQPQRSRGPLIAGATAGVILAVALAASFIFRGPHMSDPAAPPMEQTVTNPMTTVTVPAVPATSTPQTTTAPDTADVTPVPDAARGWVYNPELSGEERVALVSEWAQERNLLTGDEVVVALGDSTTKPADAASPEVANYPDHWGFGFLSPFPSDEAVMDTGVSYDLHWAGDSRNVIMGVSEYVIRGPAIAETYARMETGERRRNTPDERYDPAPIGVDAFAFETDGGSGAIHHLVVVNTGEALVVIATGPASPNYPEADLAESENLTREQVDNLVWAAVEKLLGGF